MAYRQCDNCGCKMTEILFYDRNDETKKLYHEAWQCPFCQLRLEKPKEKASEPTGD
jgi:hypothetical protein